MVLTAAPATDQRTAAALPNNFQPAAAVQQRVTDGVYWTSYRVGSMHSWGRLFEALPGRQHREACSCRHSTQGDRQQAGVYVAWHTACHNCILALVLDAASRLRSKRVLARSSICATSSRPGSGELRGQPVKQRIIRSASSSILFKGQLLHSFSHRRRRHVRQAQRGSQAGSRGEGSSERGGGGEGQEPAGDGACGHGKGGA